MLQAGCDGEETKAHMRWGPPGASVVEPVMREDGIGGTGRDSHGYRGATSTKSDGCIAFGESSP